MVTKDLKDYISNTDFGSENDTSYATFFVRRSVITEYSDRSYWKIDDLLS